MKHLSLLAALVLAVVSTSVLANTNIVTNTSSPAAVLSSGWQSKDANDIWKETFTTTDARGADLSINVSSLGGNNCMVSSMGPNTCAGFWVSCNSTKTHVNAGSGNFCQISISPNNPGIVTIVNDGLISGALAEGQLSFKVK
jgi:hypothetical protein